MSENPQPSCRCGASELVKAGYPLPCLLESSAQDILFPLGCAYRQTGVTPPTVREVRADDIPDPYHDLLVHERDMTSTLERYHGGPIVVRPRSTCGGGPRDSRRVGLAHEETGRPVEMGAICIDLDQLTKPARDLVLENRVPLGRILSDAGAIEYVKPLAFLKAEPNPEMQGVFWMQAMQPLFGRRTQIFSAGRVVADVVEILPPAERKD
jgi:hypothetical protein